MGFETLKSIIEFNKSQPSIEEEELSKNLCPQCFWQLKENSKGERICPICDTIYTH